MPPNPVIKIEDVTRVYRAGDIEVHALRGDVSLTVMPGEELPRPLLKYARQASLVEQPTLPGLGLQYCCSSCA